MSQDAQFPINPNLASLAELEALPGIGEGVARKIVAGRPYQKHEDLLAVKGLGERSLERIRPMLVFERHSQEGKPGIEKGTRLDWEETFSDVKENLEERLQSLGWAPSGSSPNSTQVLWLALITGIASVLISVFLSLAILGGINRTLNIGRHEAVRELSSSYDLMETQLMDLGADLESIDQRLKAVEGLSGRMTALETEFEDIREQVDTAIAEVDQLTDEVSAISEEMIRVSGKINLFDAFLEGMRDLIAGLFTPVEESPSP